MAQTPTCRGTPRAGRAPAARPAPSALQAGPAALSAHTCPARRARVHRRPRMAAREEGARGVARRPPFPPLPSPPVRKDPWREGGRRPPLTDFSARCRRVGRVPGNPLGLTHFGQSVGTQGAMWPMLVNIIPRSLACHCRQREGERLAARRARPGRPSCPGTWAKARHPAAAPVSAATARNNGLEIQPAACMERALRRERARCPAWGQPAHLPERAHPERHNEARKTASGCVLSPPSAPSGTFPPAIQVFRLHFDCASPATQAEGEV